MVLKTAKPQGWGDGSNWKRLAVRVWGYEFR